MTTKDVFEEFMQCKDFKAMYSLARLLVDDKDSGITNIKEALVLLLMIAQDKLKEA